MLGEKEQRVFSHLVGVVAEELVAQRGVGRAVEQMPPLIADAVWRTFEVAERQIPGQRAVPADLSDGAVTVGRAGLTADKQRRLEIVEGLLRALGDDRAEIDAEVARSNDRADAVERLVGDPLQFSAVQAHHILDMTVGRRTELGRRELTRERDELRRALQGPATE